MSDSTSPVSLTRVQSEKLISSTETAVGQQIPLLEVENLVTRFDTDQGIVRAVNGISFSVHQGEALGLVGESGSGKSVSVLSLLGLLGGSSARIEDGQARLRGKDLLHLSQQELRRICGTEIAMIFQDPMTSLNPVLSIGYQLREMVRHHLGMSRRNANQKALQLLSMVGVPDAARRLKWFPHQFSGGQRQRIMIAMALSCGPSLLIADEPTTGLDVTIQAQIVRLVQELQERLEMAVIWISHDLALVATLADRICVMYAGFIVEEAPTEALFKSPLHPYTLGLLGSIPGWGRSPRQPLESIPGSPPDPRQIHPGCPFAPRCVWVSNKCQTENPPLLDAGPERMSACWQIEQLQ